MAERTFGWVQEAYKLSNLKNTVSAFVLDSSVNRLLREDKIPRLIREEDGRDEFLKELSKPVMRIPYLYLKGKGSPKGYTRSNAPCSGIIQAVLPGQRKEYQSDWPADSFLRFAISIGFLGYDRTEDVCFLTEMGERYANTPADSEEEQEVLKDALLSYPPVCRILSLLAAEDHLTKFEMGARLGFVGEAGFTSIPQFMILQGLEEAESKEEKNKLLQDTEGTSDKYVRTICSWLIQMGWVNKVAKEVSYTKGRTFSGIIPQAYQLTLKGRTVLKHSTGVSKFAKIPKRVMWDMLATKVSDREYLRNRRTHMIRCLSGSYKTAEEIKSYLESCDMEETTETILDDLRGLTYIGLNINKLGNTYKIMDEITGLSIPENREKKTLVKSDVSIMKDSVRTKLSHIDHKYLVLIDLGFDGTSDRDYEIQTAELLTEELSFGGARLGDTRKPDVCIYYGENGLILDNKAYGKGYCLPMKQADEMLRYIEENQKRDISLNPNQWWKVFGDEVKQFRFGFVSGSFTGGFKDRIHNLELRSGIGGAAINSVNLLIIAEELKSGRMSYEEFFQLFDCGDEIEYT